MPLNKIRKPILFQGKISEQEYFEGWYYKQGSSDGKYAICFIPGISLHHGDSHCFLQYISTNLDQSGIRSTKTGYKRYSLTEFSYNNNPFMVRISNSIFTESMISIDLSDDDTWMKGVVEFGSLSPIKTSIQSPNIMGYFAYMPWMECYHGVISMEHTLEGQMNVDGRELSFSGGIGYIEKDWGSSFPQKYIWVQCNQFEDKSHEVSLFCSVADIPFMKHVFVGFICSIMVDKKEYRFATYNHSKLTLERVSNQEVSLLLESKEAMLHIEGCINAVGGLIAPNKGRMQETIKEGLSGEIKIRFYRRGELLYEGASQMAGIEIEGWMK